ncbi:DUF2642 domain-containing protein [Fictibacillus fluitans]|uniref:DUF2642 domain-containing protein n=1 Tax=Fictibacillus fluitans TaxID=3058422 RepID=A0ABT8HQK4_9BACL|nr:DUF2642 domain-containing protein [Fictibacillus sp. NE201]MDN4523030.1 DUF2642 domain-containing protein [Fictibacillus sp. NE201]
MPQNLFIKKMLKNTVNQNDDNTGLRDLLLSLLNSNVIVTTNFSAVSGLLTDVKADYIILQEVDGSFLLISFSNIDLVTSQSGGAQ